MLTVNAVNSTMSSVLSAIRAKTGIEFDGGQNSSERVAVNLGPAAEGEVLAGIFSGSSFDYVVLGRADSPGTVQRVILTPRARGGAGAVAGQPPQPTQNPQAQAQAQQEGDEEVPEDAADQEPQDAPVQPPPVQEPPTAQNQQQQNNQPKTPEQLLEELKQMQLQQQQQQGQPPPDTNSVPRKAPPR
jgi:hypothetical protein